MVFFPATGRRNFSSGYAEHRSRLGMYWSFSATSLNRSWSAVFDQEILLLREDPSSYGISVRCVAHGISNYSCFFDCSFISLKVLLDK